MDVSPLRAIVIASVFILLAAASWWFREVGLSLQGPSALALDSHGRLYALIHQRLFLFEASGELAAHYPLEAWGIERTLGGLGIFPNDDLLLVPERLSAPPAATTGAIEGALTRCSPVSGTCQTLPHSALRFGRYVDFEIDGDNIYLLDSQHQQIHRLTLSGELQQTLTPDLESPAALTVDSKTESLLVAESGRRSIISIPLAHGELASQRQWQRFPTRGGMADRAVGFADIDSGWAVLQRNWETSLSVIRLYDRQWQPGKTVPLPEGTYPVALERLGDSLVTAEPQTLRLLRFGLDGSPLDDLEPPLVVAYIDSLETQRDRYLLTARLCWGAFVVLLVIGLVAGLRTGLQRTHAPLRAAVTTGVIGTPRPGPRHPDITWLRRSRLDFYTLLLVPMAFCVATIVPIVIIEGTDSCVNALLLWLFVLVAIPVLPLMVFLRRLRKVRIGVLHEWVVVIFASGQEATARDCDLIVHRNGFSIQGKQVTIGIPQLYLFNQTDVQTLLLPRLDKGQRLSPGEQIQWDWRYNRGAALTSAFLLALLLIILVPDLRSHQERLSALVGKLLSVPAQCDR